MLLGRARVETPNGAQPLQSRLGPVLQDTLLARTPLSIELIKDELLLNLERIRSCFTLLGRHDQETLAKLEEIRRHIDGMTSVSNYLTAHQQMAAEVSKGNVTAAAGFLNIAEWPAELLEAFFR